MNFHQIVSKKKVLFFYPDRNIGGGPYWLIRLATELAKDPEYEVYYADYPNGFTYSMTERKGAKNVNFIDYNDKIVKSIIDNPCIVFSPIYEIYKLPNLHPDSKILFHNWHNECLPVLQRLMCWSLNELKYFMSYIYVKKAEIFVDMSHWCANNKIVDIKFEPRFVPLVIPKKNIAVNNNIINESEINIAWLGRIVIDKVYALNNIISCAKKYKTNKIINIHIIGDGDSINLIDREASNNNIKIKMCGRLTEAELHDYLSCNIDILFAMGTSCLDGAGLGIPSVIVPTSMKSFTNDNFVFLPKTVNYTSGFEPNQIKEMGLKTTTFRELLDDVYLKNRKHEMGRACLEYVHDKHSSEHSIKQLKMYLNDTELKYFDIKQLTKQKQDNILQNKLYIQKPKLLKRTKVFLYSICLACAQIPIIDLYFTAKKRERILRKIHKYWR